MQRSYNGKILRVDLGTRQIEIETPDDSFFRKYVGGSCLGAYYLLKELPVGIDPFSPDNLLIFATSIVGGLPVPGLSRNSAVSKSPLTGAIASSEAGGWVTPQIKAAGFDAIIIKGRASKPTYLWIKNGKVEFRDAGNIWGKFPVEVQKIIREELCEPLARIIQIGPAGEKRVRFASIINDVRYFYGRSGLGAVMGAKNLKAIAVKGDSLPRPLNSEKLKEIIKTFGKEWKHDTNLDLISRSGSAGFTVFQNKDGQLPTSNYRTGVLDNLAITGDAFAIYNTKSEGCYGCPVKCKRSIKVDSPYKVNPEYGGPEYESVAALGSYVELNDTAAVAKANEICNKYGMDTISAGATIAFAMECYEKGLLDKDDVDGMDINFGNGKMVLKLLEKIGNREGVGDLLAEGSYRVAQTIGGEAVNLAMQVKGQELPAHDPRVKPTMGLAYALSPTGAEHVECEFDAVVKEEAPVAQFSHLQSLGIYRIIPQYVLNKDKVRFFSKSQKIFSFLDSIDLCVYTFSYIGYRGIEDIIKAAVGWDFSIYEMILVGERRLNMFRAFNAREGFDETSDCLPKRMFEGIKSGPKKGFKIDKNDFNQAKRAYYRMMGFNYKGHPTKGKLEELDLDWVIQLLGLSNNEG